MKVERTLDGKPKVHHGTVFIAFSESRSWVHCQKEDFIAVDYLPLDYPVTFFFFVKDGDAVNEVYWADLTDDQRLLVRSSAREFIRTRSREQWKNYDPGEYNDSTYLALEVLSEG